MTSNYKKIKYKNVEWLKNISADGGALAECINNKKNNEICLMIHSTKLGRLWTTTSTDDILKLTKKNIGLYEVVDSYPYKVYFDIDGDKWCSLTNIKDLIFKYFNDAQMSISGYISNDKVSYHIILNNYLIHNDEERDKLKLIVKYLHKFDSSFDSKVYTKNRMMKCINQSKPSKPVQALLEDDKIENHFITCYFKEFNYNINDILTEEIENNNLYKLNYIEWSEIPKLELNLNIDLDLNDPLTLLKMTPLDHTFNHKYTWRVARFCYYNKISFIDFISWHSKKTDNKISYDKWERHWCQIKNHPEIDMNQYRYFLSNFYPKITQSKSEQDFLNLFNYDESKINYIDTISQKQFDFIDYKCKIFNIGMGGGKTTQTINYLDANSSDSFIWITPNISLAKNTFNRIKELSISCSIYDSAKNKADKAELISKERNIIICINSLFYTTKSYDTVIIDEIETFLKLFHNNSTLHELDSVWKKFIFILKSCKKLILLDAFISKITLDFLDNLNISYEIIRRNSEESDRKAVIKKSFNSWTRSILDDLKTNKKLIIFYPFKRGQKHRKDPLPSMSDFVLSLEQMTGKKGQFYNADQDSKINNKLKNVNENWVKYDFIVSNNKINVGLNFDLNYFDTCYLGVASFNSPRDIIQFSYRARSLKSKTIKYCFIDSFNKMDCMQRDLISNEKEIFNKLNDNIFIEKVSNLKKTFMFFLQRAKYSIENEDDKIDQPVNFIENDYYDFDKLKNYDSYIIKQIEADIYAQKATTDLILEVKKYHFINQFEKGTDMTILANLWNNNKFNLIENMKKILYLDKNIEKLKNNYNWTCNYPESIPKDFKFNEVELKNIFDNYKFKTLTSKSNHRLILTKYINTLYGSEVICVERQKGNHVKYKANEKFKEIYISISKFLRRPKDAADTEPLFID